MQGQDTAKIAAENRFIAANRERIAAFGPTQHRRTRSRGAVLIQRHDARPGMTQLNYLTVEQMAEHGLVGEDGPAIQRSVTAALEQYDPEHEIVVIFLYRDDATVYLLSIEDDLLADE